MKVLVLGSGGREHALVWKLKQSPSVEEVYVIPGSDALADIAHVVPLYKTEDIIDFAKLMKIDLTVAGPENILVEGIADLFEQEGLTFFGPSKAAAQIEGSKQFAKNLMKKYHIPTADYETFTDREKAISYIQQQKKYPIVIKADGLASGKGVVIAETEKVAIETVNAMISGAAFGKAGESIVIEEYMEGEELSVLGFADGETIIPMISSQDHKRIFDDDKGLNTGGMGAYAPTVLLTEETRKTIRETILCPVMEAMKKEGAPFKGCLYTGLMMTKDGPKVVEFNCRFGDPETEAILPLLESDLGEIMMSCAKGTLKGTTLQWKEGYAVDVVLASAGYPIGHSTGEKIRGIKWAEKECLVFHSGTKKKEGKYIVNGGRVLNVVGVAATLKEAQEKAYYGASVIQWEGMQYRHDIADKGLKHLLDKEREKKS